MPPMHLSSPISEELTHRYDALVLRGGSLSLAPLARSRLLQLAQVDFLGLRRAYLDPFAARNLSEQSSGLAEGGFHVEFVEAGDAVPGNYDVEPPHGGTGRRVMDTDVGDRAADDERIHAPQAQHMLQPRAVESVVAWLAYGRLVFVRGEPVHHLPTPASLAAVLAPDLPLRVALVVGVLDEDHPHVGLPRQLQQVPYRRYGSLGAGNDERSTLRHEIVLHVPYNQSRPTRVNPNAVLYLIPRDLDGTCHSNLLKLKVRTKCTAWEASGYRHQVLLVTEPDPRTILNRGGRGFCATVAQALPPRLRGQRGSLAHREPVLPPACPPRASSQTARRRRAPWSGLSRSA